MTLVRLQNLGKLRPYHVVAQAQFLREIAHRFRDIEVIRRAHSPEIEIISDSPGLDARATKYRWKKRLEDGVPDFTNNDDVAPDRAS